jgi:hypothetical protein
MALSFARKGRARNIVGDQYRTLTDCTFDSTYVTGGEVFTAADLGLRKVDHRRRGRCCRYWCWCQTSPTPRSI